MWRKKRAFQIEFLIKNGLQPHHHIIDVGCGTLRGGIPIIDYLDPENYACLDVRATVLEELARKAAKRLNSAQIHITAYGGRDFLNRYRSRIKKPDIFMVEQRFSLRNLGPTL